MSWLRIGKIGKAHGLRGSFFISDRDEPIPRDYLTIGIGDSEDQLQIFEIIERHWQGGRPVLSCKSILDRTAAEKFIGRGLWVRREQVKVDEQREYLWTDLTGKTIRRIDGTEIGKLHSIYNLGGGDVAIIAGTTGRTFDVPFRKEFFDMNFTKASEAIVLLISDDHLEVLAQNHK